MNNKEAISWLKLAAPVRTLSKKEFEKFIIAVNMAMDSLEKWDKIKEELEREMKEYENVLTDLDYSTGIGYALAVIEEHLEESEG